MKNFGTSRLRTTSKCWLPRRHQTQPPTQWQQGEVGVDLHQEPLQAGPLGTLGVGVVGRLGEDRRWNVGLPEGLESRGVS